MSEAAVEQEQVAQRVAELKAWREENKLSATQAAKALGYRDTDTVSAFERGKKKLTDAAYTRFERVRAGLSPVEDEPPVAEPPPRSPEDEGDESLFTMQGAGVNRKVSTQSLGRFQRLESSMFVFFAGKDVVYSYPGPEGKPVQDSFHQAGLADLLPPKDGAVVRDKAAEMAHAWAEWARTNPRVESFLSFFIMEGGLKGVLAATAPVVLTILANHGIDPLAFFLAPLREETPLPAGEPDPFAAAFVEDDGGDGEPLG